LDVLSRAATMVQGQFLLKLKARLIIRTDYRVHRNARPSWMCLRGRTSDLVPLSVVSSDVASSRGAFCSLSPVPFPLGICYTWLQNWARATSVAIVLHWNLKTWWSRDQGWCMRHYILLQFMLIIFTRRTWDALACCNSQRITFEITFN
jgi:hypothetical protein